jgi:hypothetical protein
MSNALSTNANDNAKTFATRIAKYKRHMMGGIKPANKVVNNSTFTPTTINIVTGEITPGTNEGNRLVSYTINVTCDACLSGGPYEGAFSAGSESELLIYGFDAGSEACGSVTASSTLLGDTAPSDTVCANAGAEAACEFLDCSGQEACGYEGWVGDGYCDDGSWGFFFNCDDFNCDEGDCTVECWDGSSACTGSTECPEEPTCDAGDVNGDGTANVQDIVLIVGYILDGNADFDLGCADANADGSVNVQDIVVIVNGILGGRTTSDATEATLNINGGSVSLKADGFIGAVQMTLSHDLGFVIDLTDKAMVADYRTNLNSTTLIVVAPDSDHLFDATGEFTISEVMVYNSENEIPASATPSEFGLSSAYPNPFNPSTSLNVAVPADGFVSISVYNVMGQQVDVIHSGNMTAGTHNMTWNASDMTSGVYFVRAESSNATSVQKVMLMK